MLHCISIADLPRQPRQLKLLHHGMGAVAIVAVSYGQQRALSSKYFFSLLEIPLPHANNTEANTPRLIHMRSPRPDMSVESVTPFRSCDGDAVYLLVQCSGGEVGQEVAATYLYRRKVVQVGQDDANGGDCGNDADGVTRRSSRAAARYERLPKAVDTSGRVWTATAPVLTTESAIAVQPGHDLPRPLVLAASGSGIGPHLNALQWVELTGPTRAEVVKTVELPALSRFEVTSVVPTPGSGGRRALLLCHHAVVEVEASLAAGGTTTAVSNVAITRTWKWSPHDRLTSCCLKDYTLCAGTEDGVLVLWDLRQSGDEVGSPSTSCTAAASAVTGLCAPQTSSGFVTCAMDGTLLSWQHVDDDGAAATLAWQQQQQMKPEGAANSWSVVHGGAGMHGSSGRGHGAAAAALVSERDMRRRPGFPYVAAPPGTAISVAAPAPKMGVLPGTPGCVAMVGEGNLLAVGRDLGQVEVYICD